MKYKTFFLNMQRSCQKYLCYLNIIIHMSSNLVISIINYPVYMHGTDYDYIVYLYLNDFSQARDKTKNMLSSS